MPVTSPILELATVPEATLTRICTKLEKCELKLKKDLRKVKALLPHDANDFFITPPGSVNTSTIGGGGVLDQTNASQQGGAVGGVTPAAQRPRIQSDASVKTLWSGSAEQHGLVSPLTVVQEVRETDVSNETNISAPLTGLEDKVEHCLMGHWSLSMFTMN